MILYTQKLEKSGFAYMRSTVEFIRSLAAQGQMAFTIEDMMDALNLSRKAAIDRLLRLKQHGEITSLIKNFYVIVPFEYHHLGCLPAQDLVPLLMEHWQIPYYVCLLSAARYHGATHQAVNTFTIMIDHQKRSIQKGKVKIDFIVKSDLTKTPTQRLVTNTGYLVVSTPEATALDLFIYAAKSGGLNHIATVLAELIESIEPKKLSSLAKKNKDKLFLIQRLGYVLENIKVANTKAKDKCIKILSDFLLAHETVMTPLEPGLPTKDCRRDSKWNVIVNSKIESDI